MTTYDNPLEEARSLRHGYAAGVLSPEELARFQQLRTEILSPWRDEDDHSVADICSCGYVNDGPEHCAVCGGWLGPEDRIDDAVECPICGEYYRDGMYERHECLTLNELQDRRRAKRDREAAQRLRAQQIAESERAIVDWAVRFAELSDPETEIDPLAALSAKNTLLRLTYGLIALKKETP